MKYIKDFIYWYKYNAPRYGYIMSVSHSLFNCLYLREMEEMIIKREEIVKD